MTAVSDNFTNAKLTFRFQMRFVLGFIVQWLCNFCMYFVSTEATVHHLITCQQLGFFPTNVAMKCRAKVSDRNWPGWGVARAEACGFLAGLCQLWYLLVLAQPLWG